MLTITSSLRRSLLASAVFVGTLVSFAIAVPAIASMAISDYDAAITTKATTADDFYNRGIYFQGQGQLETALDQFSQAIALDARNPDYYFSRGLTYSDNGDQSSSLSGLLNSFRAG